MSILNEAEPFNDHEVMQAKLINARNGETVLFYELLSTAKKHFSDYEGINYIHCVLLRHFA